MTTSVHSAHPVHEPRDELDTGRRPGVAAVPECSAARRAIAGAIVGRALRALPLRVDMGAAGRYGTAGPLMRVHAPEAFHRRIAVGGLIGFGESYMAGEWDAEDVVGVLTVLAGGVATLVPPTLQRLRPLWATRQPDVQRNTPTGSRSNIRQHYDLSNELFALFLDETLSYSAGVFDRTPESWTRPEVTAESATWDELPAAQHHKIDRLLDLSGVGPGCRLLEIGTGWGELAIRAARRGATVHTVTLSAEQQQLARIRVAAAGLEDRVTVGLTDYRDIGGSYDAVVSVEMIEAVGAEYWPTYFRALDTLLVPGGRAALQAITMPHDRMLASTGTHTWIQKYIFPGGMIPSVQAVRESVAAHTSLRVDACDGYGTHYAETLRLWRERFTAHEAEVDALGFDAVFRRMWTFYLAYSEAGFRSRYLDVHQILLTKPNSPPTAPHPNGVRR